MTPTPTHRSAENAPETAHGLRLTQGRAFVLETLAASDRALTAYQLLDRLRAAGSERSRRSSTGRSTS